MDKIFENDQKLKTLLNKLSEYQSKLEVVRAKFYRGTSKDVSPLLEKLNKAINITNGLIEKRKEEIKIENEDKLRNTAFKIGENVYGKHNNVWYVGKVEKIIERSELINFEYGINFIGIEETSILCPNKKNIKKYEHPMTNLRPGIQVLAVWESDGKFYPSTIDSLDDYGYVWVKYKGYKGVSKIKTENIRLCGSFGEELYGKEGEQKSLKRNRDFDKKKKRKRRKIEKEKEIEAHMEKKTQNWKNFMGKKSKLMKKSKKKVKKDLGGTREKRNKFNTSSKKMEGARNVVEEYQKLKEFENRNVRSERSSRSRYSYYDY